MTMKPMRIIVMFLLYFGFNPMELTHFIEAVTIIMKNQQ